MTNPGKSIKTPLNRVRGLGAAKTGVGHFWHQRLTAVALIPLGLWFLFAVRAHIRDDYAAMRAWLAEPVTAVLMLLFVSASLYHMYLGLQVVFEDYIHKDGVKLAHFIVTAGIVLLLGAFSAFAILKISLGS